MDNKAELANFVGGIDRTTALLLRAQMVVAGELHIRELVKDFWGNAHLDDHQVDIVLAMLQSLLTGQPSEIAIKGCTGAGKGAGVSIGVNLWLELVPTAKIIVSSVDFLHAQRTLFREIGNWRRKLLYEPEGEILSSEIRINPEKYVHIVNPETGEGFSGQHGKYVCFLFDEACHDHTTEVLTDKGWKQFQHLDGTEKLLTMNPATGLSEYRQPTAIICNEQERNRITHLPTRRLINFSVTPNHRMLYRYAAEKAWREGLAGELAGQDRKIEFPVAIDWYAEELDIRKHEPIGRDDDQDNWLRIWAWYLGGGSCPTDKKAIFRMPPEAVYKCAQAMSALGFDDYRVEHDHVVVNSERLVHILGGYCTFTTLPVPRWMAFCSRRQLNVFVDELLKLCSLSKKFSPPYRHYFQGYSHEVLGFVQELVLKAGYLAEITSSHITKPHKMHCQIYERRTVSVGGGKLTWTKSEGPSYCVDLPPYHTIYTRRQGKGMWSCNSRVREDFWDLAATQAKLRVALSNPRTLSGWFRRLFPADEPDKTQTIKMEYGAHRRLVTVSGLECLNVRLGKEIIPGQITKQALLQIMGNADPMFGRVFGEGKFPIEDAEFQLIAPSWLERHTNAFKRGKARVDSFGLDVSDSEDGDETVLCAGSMQGVTGIHAVKKSGLMKICGWVLSMIRREYGIDLEKGQYPICVDSIGVGKGVADRLEELGCWVIKHQGGARADENRQYVDKRTEAWALLADRLNPAGKFPEEPFLLPHDSMLLDDLVAQEKIYQSDGIRWRLMPKSIKGGGKEETLRKKLGRSPDRGEGVVYMYQAAYTQQSAPAQEIDEGAMLIADPDEGNKLEQDDKAEIDDFLKDILDEFGDERQEEDDDLFLPGDSQRDRFSRAFQRREE